LKPLGELLKTALSAVGYQLADWENANNGKLLRVFIEKQLEQPEQLKQSGPVAGITLEDCEAASRQIQRVLEVEGIEYGRLEVSSPGLDRKLKTAADFARFAGHEAIVEFRSLVNGRRHIVGMVERVEGDSIELHAEGGSFRFDLANLRRARLVPRV
jgi:ribosome maturation factor RimP